LYHIWDTVTRIKIQMFWQIVIKNKGDNVYHKILLPEHVDKKFNSISELMNEVERCEKRKDSQLLKDIILALPDDKELTFLLTQEVRFEC